MFERDAWKKEYDKEYYEENKDKIKEYKKAYMKEYNIKNKDKIKQKRKELHTRKRKVYTEHGVVWRRNNPEKRLLMTAKQGSKRRNLGFDLELQDIIIPEYCPYLKIKLDLSYTGRTFSSPSIDRIDNSKGYVKGNVHIISDLANKMKNSATIDQLVQFAKGVLEMHDRP